MVDIRIASDNKEALEGLNNKLCEVLAGSDALVNNSVMIGPMLKTAEDDTPCFFISLPDSDWSE